MTILFQLSEKESFDRQLTALWAGGFGEDLLKTLLPEIEKLAKAHYLAIADSGTGGSLDSRLGIETGAMFEDLTTPIIRNDSIILDTSLDYAMAQEERLKESGRSFLPSEDEVFKVLQAVLAGFS